MKERKSPGLLILKQGAVACNLSASDKGWPWGGVPWLGPPGMRTLHYAWWPCRTTNKERHATKAPSPALWVQAVLHGQWPLDWGLLPISSLPSPLLVILTHCYSCHISPHQSWFRTARKTHWGLQRWLHSIQALYLVPKGMCRSAVVD